MSRIRTLGRVLPVAFLIALAGCGTLPTGQIKAAASATAVAQGVPPASAFQVVHATVTSIAPDDTSGLPHQNFYVAVDAADGGGKLAVNNDTKYGQKVQGLKVGDHLTIKGVEYHDSHADGIHWTHHANRANDAGYIQTADGHVYQ